MLTEWKQNSTVREGGRIEVTVPGLHAGDVVEVRVRIEEKMPNMQERPLGLLKGKFHIGADFDAPLDAFDEYTK
ncbi:MAG TPA: hypothetical protein VFC78_04095 [Tepidisphaeraceae bacterium]|nr:hypothetical protein [Tepidisphaeraceae bacterium]